MTSPFECYMIRDKTMRLNAEYGDGDGGVISRLALHARGIKMDNFVGMTMDDGGDEMSMIQTCLSIGLITTHVI